MARPKKNPETAQETSKRPAEYIAQQGAKAIFTLADLADDHLFAELRRRGYTGELRYSKVISV